MESQERAILYEEPGITAILILSGFLLALNGINYLFDKLVYCGLVGQIFIGVAFGTPGLQWLSTSFESTIVQLGYLGLILLVYEGGLSTETKLLRSNIWLCSGIAITGIVTPIALSFVLQAMLDITSLQAFAAGAALCSTSLGTTFTILQTTDLARSKLGVVLAGAAMMDDVVGLVLVQIISSLGSSTTVSAATVVRPICVSLAYAIVTPILCLLAARPFVRCCFNIMKIVSTMLGVPERATVLVAHTSVLVTMVTSASYAGTSNLFAAYLAGAAVTWWDNTRPAQSQEAPNEQQSRPANAEIAGVGNDTGEQASTPSEGEATSSDTGTDIESPIYTGSLIYEHYFSRVVAYLLRPFFFASIGFSIPIANMFNGQLVWRGIVYTLLMLVGKVVCGLWLIRLNVSMPNVPAMKGIVRRVQIILCKLRHKDRTERSDATPSTAQSRSTRPQRQTERKHIDKPQSLYPGVMVGCAMVSRGEIGFLVSAIAQSSGLYTSSGSSDLFLIVTWAVMLCTILGPILTGLLTRRVWRLQHDERARQSGRGDPLGAWGAS